MPSLMPKSAGFSGLFGVKVMWMRLKPKRASLTSEEVKLCVAEDEAVEVEALALPKALVGEEEEGSVLAAVDGGAALAKARQVERAAQVSAELVALEGRRVRQREVEEVARVERVVAQELE